MLLVIFIAIGLVANLALSNPNLRARISMLSRGHVFVELKSPDPNRPGEPRSNEFVSKNAYKRGVWIGSIDRYGDFIPNSADGIDMRKEYEVAVGLYIVQIVSWGMAVIVLWRYLHRRKTTVALP